MKNILIYIGAILVFTQCKKPYEPEIIKKPDNLLVVEGVINGNPNSTTEVLLSRLRKLSDTSYNSPEFNATVSIEQEAGSVITLQPQDSGRYLSTPLTLDQSKRYRLLVNTADGKKYVSDFTPIVQTPPIDSVTWEQNNDVSLFVNTHDPNNNTHYYRWDYIETWEYHSFYDALLKFTGDTVVYDFVNSTHVCWLSAHSTEISLGNTIALGGDVITHARIGGFPHNSQKGSERYSALVRQYALSQEAYQYWLQLQKISQQLGTLFDVQPSQLQGNIHAVSGSETVIGYIGASTVSENRIFIAYKSLTDWKEFDGNTCQEIGTVYNTPDIDKFVFGDGYYSPIYFRGMNNIVYTRTPCVDCRTQGGTTTKPSFW